jgi:mono/diheme cytochrome c family protein
MYTNSINATMDITTTQEKGNKFSVYANCGGCHTPYTGASTAGTGVQFQTGGEKVNTGGG